MKLLVISGFWPSQANTISGIFVAQQAAAFGRIGCDVTVIRPAAMFKTGNRAIAPSTLGLNQSIRLLTVPFVGLPPTRFGSYALVWNWYSCGYFVHKYMRRLADINHYQAVLCHGLMWPAWKKVLQTPSATILHGVDPFFQVACNERSWQKRLNLLWISTDWVIIVGEPLQGYAYRLGVPRSKICIIPNGTDIPGKVVNPIKRQRSPSERRVILSISNLIPLKGIDFNLYALAQINAENPSIDWQYRIVGDGPERQRLEYLAEKLMINDRVIFLGRLPYPETMLEIDNCDLFSLPSWGEAFGIVYLEAMARGRPVIGCRGWGAQVMVRHNQDGILVEPKNVHSLKEALQQLISNPHLAAAMGRSARYRAKKFTWENNARRILDLFHFGS